MSVVPAIFNGFSATTSTTTTVTANNIVQTVFAQGEDPFPVTNNETLTPAQQQAREELLKEKGFSVNVIARNLIAPLTFFTALMIHFGLQNG